MFFSRGTPKQKGPTNPGVAASPGLTAKEATEGRHALAQRTNDAFGLPEGGRATVQEDILDVKNAPAGEYIPLDKLDIPLLYADSFLFVRSGDGIIMLSTIDAWATAPFFELQRKLRQDRHKVLQMRRASREVVRALHRAAQGRAGAETDRSETQTQAQELINRAIAAGCSDIHIETRGSFAQVWFRIHGERLEQPNLSFETAMGICSTLYGFEADSNSKEVQWDPDSIKECAIDHETPDGRRAQLRFISSPIHPASDKNFQCVIRVLMMEVQRKAVEDVGYSVAQVDAIEEMLVGAQGLVLLVGPTNSGKSTSMQAFIERIYEVRGRSIKVVTVEDPVEYVIANACQMGVPKGRKALQGEGGSIFRSFLKATLRLDPDVVMVGEIRDAESAGSTKDLGLAGRKLLSTLHVYEAYASFERLIELGVPRSVLYMPGFISGIIFQRLVPRLCECAIPFVEAVELNLVRPALVTRVSSVSDLQVDDVRIRRSCGCEKCGHTGIAGRTLCAEVLVPDETFLALIKQGDEIAARAHWNSNQRLANGDMGVRALAHAIAKMKCGEVDPHDVETQVGILKVQYSTSGGNPVGSDGGLPDRYSAMRMKGEGE